MIGPGKKKGGEKSPCWAGIGGFGYSGERKEGTKKVGRSQGRGGKKKSRHSQPLPQGKKRGGQGQEFDPSRKRWKKCKSPIQYAKGREGEVYLPRNGREKVSGEREKDPSGKEKKKKRGKNDSWGLEKEDKPPDENAKKKMGRRLPPERKKEGKKRKKKGDFPMAEEEKKPDTPKKTSETIHVRPEKGKEKLLEARPSTLPRGEQKKKSFKRREKKGGKDSLRN